jgi:hypothetical protein
MGGHDDRTLPLRAAVGPKVLAQADRYFTNRIADVAIELLQNARRAGASKVEVTFDGVGRTASVTDDGRGLAADEARLLITLGASGNPGAVEHDETPAGMGFFALARRGATVRCRDWSLDVPPDAFRGVATATLRVGLPVVAGTTVSFPIGTAAGGDGREETAAAFREAASPMPFDARVDGTPVRRHRPADQIVGPDGTRLADDYASRTVGDCTVVVGRYEDGRAANANPPPYVDGYEPHRLMVAFDVFGHVIRPTPDEVDRLHPAFAVAAEGDLRVRVPGTGGAWGTITPAYVAVVEALGPQALATRLPDRGDLLSTHGLADVLGAVVDLMATLAARAARNAVPDWHPLREVDLGAAGPIPPRQVVATRPRGRDVNTADGFSGTDYDRPTPLPHPSVVVENGSLSHLGSDVAATMLVLPARTGGLLVEMLAQIEVPDHVTLLEATGPLDVADPVDAAALLVDGRRIEIGSGGSLSDEAVGRPWADGLLPTGLRQVGTLGLELTTRGGVTFGGRLAHAVGPAGPDQSPSLLVTSDADAALIAEALARTVPWYGPYGDGWQTHRDRFLDETYHWLARRLRTTAENAAHAIATALRPFVEGGAGPELDRVSVTISGVGAAGVAVEAIDGSFAREEIGPREARRRPGARKVGAGRGRTRTMGGSVGTGILGQVGRLFGDDLRSIADELLHAARRAGAGMVSVRTDPDDESVTVSDDGAGLPAERAATLLSVGGSEDGEGTGREGWLGLAALARRGAVVSSGDWSMTIPPGTFGRADAVLTTGRQWRRGLAVTFRHPPCRTTEGRAATRAAFAEAAEAMPFATVIDDGAVRRRRPIDRLFDAGGRPVADATVSRTVGDCVITLGRFEDGARAGTSGHGMAGGDAPWITVTADVQGTAVAVDADAVAALHPALVRPAEGRLVVRGGSSVRQWWSEVAPAYVAVLEAVGCETLATRLADRRSLVRTEGLDAVGAALVAMVGALAARAPRNALPTSSPFRIAASAVGIRIPEAQIVAFHPRGRSANTSDGFAGCHRDREHGPADCVPVIVVDGGTVVHRDPTLPRDGALVRLPPFGPTFSMLLEGAARRAPLDRLIEVDGDLAGVAAAREADLVIDGTRTPIARDGRFGDEDVASAWAASGRAPGLAVAGTLVLEIRTDAGRKVTIPLSFAVVDPSGPVETQGIVLTPGADPVAVVEAMVNASPWYDSERDDGWTTQLHRFRDRASGVVRNATGPRG